MPSGANVVQTRQRPEELFRRASPLGASEELESDVKLVAGYDSLALFSVSDQAFSIVIEEANHEDGPFVVTGTYASAASGANQYVCTRHRPCGTYAKIRLENGGAAMGLLKSVVAGIPAGS